MQWNVDFRWICCLITRLLWPVGNFLLQSARKCQKLCYSQHIRHSPRGYLWCLIFTLFMSLATLDLSSSPLSSLSLSLIYRALFDCVSAVSEFNRFYSPSAPPDTVIPMMASASMGDQLQEPRPGTSTDDLESTLPPIDPAMFRLPFPGSELMKSGAASAMDTGAATRPQDWLSKFSHRSRIRISRIFFILKI